MPVVFRHHGFRFLFFSNEGDPREPVHVHVRRGDAQAKFWLDPEVTLEGAFGLSAVELRELAEVVRQHRDLIREKWHEHFGR